MPTPESPAANERLYAVAWGGSIRSSVVVQAATAEEAVVQAKKHVSVWALNPEGGGGVLFSVWRLGNFPLKFHVAYDGVPMTESHGATNAKLVTKPLGRSRV